MGPRYDKYYDQEAYFGQPYPGLVEFFENHPQRNSVLDLGCGQGRDAIMLGRLGYHVTGVDLSTVGIRQMNEAARQEKLDVQGKVADLYTFAIDQSVDIILLDSIIHLYKKDYEREKQLLTRILKQMKPGGLLCNFMLKGKTRENELKKIYQESKTAFKVLRDDYTEYPAFQTTYHMYIIQKQINASKGR